MTARRPPAGAWVRFGRLGRPDVRADVDDEIEFHIQTIADRYVAQGLAPAAARARALAEFGDIQWAREACVAIDETQRRAERRTEVLGAWWQDVRHGARRLLKSPGFTVVTVLTLAIGLGPTISIFSLINGVLLKPLPYAAPDELMVVNETFPLAGGRSGTGSVSWGNFVDWRAQNTVFAELAIAGYPSSATLGRSDPPERLSVAAVGASTFPMLGVRPLLGRLFRAGEDSAGAPEVVVLGEGLWRRKYAADPTILGRAIVLDGTPTTVIGVMPARVVFPNRSRAVDAWVPLRVTLPAGTRGSHAFMVVGRLRPGVTRAAAAAQMRQIAARIAADHPRDQEGRGATVTPLRETVVGGVRKQLLVLMGAAALVLLIACANAASLLLARAAVRRREVAVLAAIGASRGRIVQQFLVESLLLAAAGAALGFALAVAAVRGIRASAGTMLPRTTEIHIDGGVVAFVAGAIFLTTLLFGLAPAFRAARTDLQDCLREGGREGSGGRGTSAFRSALVVAQFALSLVLLAGAGLLIRTFAALVGTPTGMRTEQVLTMHLPFPLGSEKYKTGDVAIARFHQPLLDQIRAMPGVRAAGMISKLPLQDFGTNGNFTVAGKTYASTGEQPFAEFRVVSPGYFATLGIAVRRGRDVRADDDSPGTPVVMVNETVVRKYFPGEDPIGKQLYFGPPGPNNPPLTIVGVAGDVRQARLEDPPAAEVYIPYTLGTFALSDMALVVRADRDPLQLVKPIQRAVRALDADQPVYDVRTMDDVVAASVADRRLYLRLLAAFAAVALSLAVAGVYGVMAYAVTQRTREFGIRLALGSGVSRVQRMVVWQGTRLAMLGLAIGVPAALALTRLLGSVLYGVSPTDPLTFAAVALLLAGVGVIASYVPARRVSRVDPIIAMRTE